MKVDAAAAFDHKYVQRINHRALTRGGGKDGCRWIFGCDVPAGGGASSHLKDYHA